VAGGSFLCVFLAFYFCPLLFFLLFCFVSVSLLFLLVVELLSIVAQGVSRGSDEKGKR